MTLNQLFDGFMLAKEADGVQDTTLKMYRWMIRYLSRYLSTEKLQDANSITAQDLQGWVVSLKEKGYASATRDQRIAKAKTFFKWGFDNGFLESDPSVALKRPKNDWQPDPFSPDELHFLLDQSKRGSMGVRDHSIVCTLLDTGLRAGELVRLKPEDVSIKTGQVKVYHGKGGKSRTTIIGKRSKEALWRWMTIRPESPYLYCTSTGRRMLESHLYLTIKRIGDKVSIRAYPHRFRHTFATQYLKLGGDPYSLQYLLGH